MTIFLQRLLRISPRHGVVLIGAAVCRVLGGGVAFAATQHIPVTTG